MQKGGGGSIAAGALEASQAAPPLTDVAQGIWRSDGNAALIALRRGENAGYLAHGSCMAEISAINEQQKRKKMARGSGFWGLCARKRQACVSSKKTQGHGGFQSGPPPQY